MPSLDIEQLGKRLKDGKRFVAVLLLGADLYLREQCRNALIEHLVPEGARDWALARLSARDADAEDVLQRAQTLPMLSPQQVIVVGDLEAWQKGGDEEDGSPSAARGRNSEKERGPADLLAEYLENPAPFTTLIFEAAELDGRRKLAKLLLEKALVVSTNLSDAADEDQRRAEAASSCRQLLPQLAKDLGCELEPAAADDLADATNGSLALARVELEKLALYAGARKRITAGDVERLVVSARQYSVWQFANILAQRDRRKALAFLASLLQEGEQPVAIIGAMAWMYRALLGAQELPRGTSSGQAAGRLRMRFETAELAMREAPRIPREKLVSGLRALAEADNRLKSGNADDDALMEFLAAELTA